MMDAPASNSTNKKRRASLPLVLIRIWLLLTSLEGLVAAVMLIRTPGDPDSAFLLGLSKSRWAMLTGILGVVVVSIFLVVRFWRSTPWSDRIAARLNNWLNYWGIYYTLALFSMMGVVLLSQLLQFSTVVSDLYVAGYMQRLRPFFFLGLVVSFQTFGLLPLMRYGIPSWQQIIEKKLLVASLVAFAFLLVLGVVVAVTEIGITPDLIGWDAPGVPVIAYQVGLVWGCGLIFLALSNISTRMTPQARRVFLMDILVSLVLWGLAVGFWAREPLVPAFFTPAPRAPNYEYYPHSDAALHDTTAQFLLIGAGFPGITRKPLYALFLALLHSLAGQDYQRVAFFQVVVLAFLPVMLYWLLKRLHHRVSGIVAAGLIIIRETNAIRLAGVIGVSHAKMLMSDLPATLAIVLLTWFLVLWAQETKKRRFLPMVVGGCLGLLMLLRPQTSVLVPAIYGLVVLVSIKRPRVWLGNAGLVTLGLFLTLAPWLARSYTLTGEFALNDPNQNSFLTQQYHLQPGTEILRRLPGESQADYIQRVNQYLVDFVRQNPKVVAGFITSHFMHNQVEMLQALPVSTWIVQNPDSTLFPYWKENWSRTWGECCSVFAYVARVGYWDPQREPIRRDQLFPMTVTLGLLAVGFGVMWRRRDISSWIPLGVSLFYNLSTAVGRYSGWRLILPADWVVFLYLAIGLGQAALWLCAYYIGKPVSVFDRPSTEVARSLPEAIPARGSSLWIKGSALGLLFLGLGLIPLIVEKAIPARYLPGSRDELVAMLQPTVDSDLQAFIQDADTILLQGLALYPRFYKGGEGEPGDDWAAFSDQDFARTGFIMLTPSQRISVVLPGLEAPEIFPNASDVIVTGCQGQDFFEAFSVTFTDEMNPVTIYSSHPGLNCSLKQPEGGS